MKTRRIVCLVAVVSLAVLLLGAGPAEAKKKHKKPSSPPVSAVSASQTTSADDQPVTVTATCPQGMLAVGGGFDSQPVFSPSGAITDLNLVYESRRVGDASWRVSAVREDAGGPGPVVPITGIADCRSSKLTLKKPGSKKASLAKKRKKKKRKLVITEVSGTATTAVASGSQASAAANCPGGTQALGGGFSSSPTPTLGASVAFPVFWANYRTTPNTWGASMSNSGNVARTITSFAYCASGLKISETSGSATLAASGPGTSSVTAATTPCRKGLALLGGGFDTTPPGPSSAIAILTADKFSGGTWQTGALNLNAVPGTVGSHGYCA